MHPRHLPKISIILVCFNAKRFIETALLSVINQDYSNYELIVVDGDSNDETKTIIQKYAQKIAHLISEPDSGAADAQNKGLALATGELITFLFADDWFNPNCFKLVASTYTKNKSVDMIVCGVDHVINTESQQIQRIRRYDTIKRLDFSLENLLFGTPNIGGKFFSSKLVKKLGKFIVFKSDKTHFYANDLEFLMRASLLPLQVQYIHGIGYTYLCHKDSYNFGASNKFTILLLNERVMIADDYLASEQLTGKERKLLKKYKIDNLFRIKVRQIISGNINELFGLAKLSLIYPKSLIEIIVKFISRKIKLKFF